jgi:hypothetical protein
MRALLTQGIHEFLEPGPGTVLSGLLAKIDRSASRRSVGTVDDVQRIQEGEAGS